MRDVGVQLQRWYGYRGAALDFPSIVCERRSLGSCTVPADAVNGCMCIQGVRNLCGWALSNFKYEPLRAALHDCAYWLYTWKSVHFSAESMTRLGSLR